MKKRILQFLGICGANLLIGYLARLSFEFLIFSGDPILASAPMILALPGILLQPWFVPFFFLPYGPVIAWIPTSAVTMAIYAFCYQKGKLIRVNAFLAKARKARLIWTAGIIAIAALVISASRYYDFPALHRSLPESLKRQTKDMNLNLSNPRYFCLGQFLDSEWLCRASISEQELQLLVDRLKMHSISLKEVSPEYWCMRPYWWQPKKSDRIRILVTPEFSMNDRGPDGWHAIATWNKDDRVVYIWIKDNF